jgi:hypothetical protein
MPPEHRRRGYVRDEQRPKLAVIIALDEEHASLPRHHAKLVEPAIDMPYDGTNIASHDRLE